jgi:predicted amidohydrolase
MIQSDIAWEDKETNLRCLRARLQGLSGATEIVVLPEMFSTGFSMNSKGLAEPADGPTMTTLQGYAATFGMAIAGSFVCSEGNTCRNRAFFITPDGERFFYDKRHLFRMGGEHECYTAGTDCPIIGYRGWNIMLQVCYDLRFPAWSRNTGCKYDLLIYVANWPEQRRMVWDTLLRARSLENQAYVCGVNRTGTDGCGLSYNGGSAVLSPKGEYLAQAEESSEPVTATISMDSLKRFRQKFPAWMDADSFNIS